MILPHPLHVDVRKPFLPLRDPRDIPPPWDIQRELGYVWERSTFTVPDSVPDERVQFKADRYMKKFGDYLEGKGFAVIKMERPTEDHGVIAAGTTPSDRRRYVIYAKVSRRPVEVTVDVPDADVPIYQASGFVLV